MVTEFPILSGGNSELTAAQINAVLDQLRRQSRLFSAPPLEVTESADGWHIRLRSGGDRDSFFARIQATEGEGVYSFLEVLPDSEGMWSELPSGRSGAAREANRREDVSEGEVVWIVPPEEGDEITLHCFTAPVTATQTLDLIFWGKITEEDAGTYGYIEQAYAGGVFRDKDDSCRRASAGDQEAAWEANGTLSVPVGTIVLMVLTDEDTDSDTEELPVGPVFSYGVSGGFWVRLGDIVTDQSVVLDLAVAVGEDLAVAPAGGSFRLELTADSVEQTASIAFDAEAQEVQEALEAISFVLFGNVLVTGVSGGPWTIRFINDRSGSNLDMRVLGESLLYGDAPKADAAFSTAVATGDYRDRIALTVTPAVQQAFVSGINPPWQAVQLSASGTWYDARTSRFSVHEGATTTYVGYQGSSGIQPLDVKKDSIVFLEKIGVASYQVTAYDYTVSSGVWYAPDAVRRGVEITLRGETADERQVLELYAPGSPSRGRATGGTFTLRYAGEETAEISWDAVRQDVIDELEKLSGIGVGNVTAAGGPLPLPMCVTFTGARAGEAMELLTVGVEQLETDSDDEAVIRIYREPVQRITWSNWNAATNDAMAQLGYDGQDTAALNVSSVTAIALQAQLQALASIGSHGVRVILLPNADPSDTAQRKFEIVFQHSLAGETVVRPLFQVTPVKPGSLIQSGVAAAESLGETESVSGTCKLCFGAQYRFEIPATAYGSYAILLNGTSLATVQARDWEVPALLDFPITLANGVEVVGKVALWRRPPVSSRGAGTQYMAITDWPKQVPWPVVSVNSASLTNAYLGNADLPRGVAMTFLGHHEGEGWQWQLSAFGLSSGGSWRFLNLDFVDTISGLTTPSSSLPWNATASDVADVLRDYRFRVANRFPTTTGTWSSIDQYPLQDVVVSGGPLNTTPITIQLADTFGSNLRDFLPPATYGTAAGGSLINYPFSSAYGTMIFSSGNMNPYVFLTDGRNLTGPAAPVVTLTRLDSAAISLPGTPATLHAALAATEGGAGVQVVGMGLTAGVYRFAYPDYQADQDRHGPFDSLFVSEPALTSGVLLYKRDAVDDGDFLTQASGAVVDLQATPGSGSVIRSVNTDGIAVGIAPRRSGFWVRTYGASSQIFAPVSGDLPNALYHWMETAPGGMHLPRVSGFVNRLAQESNARIDVPTGAMVWLDDAVVPRFSYGIPPAAAPVRLTGNVGYLINSITDFSTGPPYPVIPLGYYGGGSPAALELQGDWTDAGWGESTSFGNALLWSAQATPDTHRGRVTVTQAEDYAGELRIGSYSPAFRNQDYSGGSHAVSDTWYVPGGVQAATHTTSGVITGGDRVYFDTAFTPAFPTDGQEMGDGNKAVAGALYLWDSLAGGTSTSVSGPIVTGRPTGRTNPDHFGMPSYSNGSTFYYGGNVAFLPGRSEIQSLFILLAAYSSGVTSGYGYVLDWSGYGSTPAFDENISGDSMQQRLDAVFGAGNCLLISEPQYGFTEFGIGWQFAGTLARRPMPAPTLTSNPTGWRVVINQAGYDETDAHGTYEFAPIWPSGSGRILSSYQTGGGRNGSTGTIYDWESRETGLIADFPGGGAFGIQDDSGDWLPGFLLSNDPSPAVARKRFYTNAIGFRHTGGKGLRRTATTFFGGFGTATGQGGSTFRFEGGICHSAQSEAVLGGTFTFPTRDGRTATVVNGFIVSVA